MTFNQLASRFLKLPEDQIRDELTPQDIPDWDSMNYLIFIADLEKAFNVSFSMDEVVNAKCIGDLRTALAAKGAAV